MNPQVRYLNWPKLPDELVELILSDISKNKNMSLGDLENYKWTTAYKTKVKAWCDANIASNLIWGVQVITGDLAIHYDYPTKVKISYIIETGGDNVLTEFYEDIEKTKPLHSLNIEPFRWHILHVCVPHQVRGVEPGKVRISLTGRIF